MQEGKIEVSCMHQVYQDFGALSSDWKSSLALPAYGQYLWNSNN